MNRKILAYVFFVLVVGLIAVGCGGGGGGGGSAVNPVAVPVNTGSVANLTGVVSFENVPLANAKVFLYPSASAYMGGIAQLSSVKANVIAQTLNNDGSYSTFTDGQGRYNFTAVPVGNYTLIAAKDQNHQFARTNVILGAVTRLDAQLTPTGSVTGVVQIVNNSVTENVSGAIVYLDGTSYVAVSALDGKFTIANVPANQDFSLKVISSRGVPTTSPSVTITPGSTQNAGTILLSAPNVVTSTVSGQVSISGVTSPDTRLAGHMILLTAANQPPLINMTDDAGSFAFIVKTAGNYRVTPIPEEYDSVPLNQDVNVIPGQNVALSQVFALQAEPVLTLYMVGGSLHKTAKAFDEVDEGGVPLTLTDTASGKTYAAVTNPAGGYNFEVPAGEYELAVGGGYSFETPLTPNPFTVSASLSIAAFGIAPTADVILVHGYITKVAKAFNEANDGGVPLTLTSTAASGITYPAVSGPDGSFAFYVPAGDYYFSVGGGYQFVTDPLAGSPLTVSGTYAFANTIDLRPTEIPYVLVRGKVSKLVFALNESDQGGVNLTLTATDASGRIYSAITDEVGSFAFMVPPGQYDLSVSGLYRLQNNPFPGNPINIIPGFSFPNTINVVPTRVEWHVTGVVSKDAKAFGETDEAGVNLTLTSQATNVSYSAISDSLGQFSFVVPPGNYDFAVGGGYKFKNAFVNPLVVNNNISFGTAFVVVPSNGVFFNVTGTVQKSPKLPGETDESGVVVQLKSNDDNAPILETLTSANGSFRFQVPAQTYNLRVTGSYRLSTTVAPGTVTTDFDFGTLVVNPSSMPDARIFGSISPANQAESYEIRLWDDHNARYVRTINTVSGADEYSFNDVPPGDYRVFVIPVNHGFFAESPVINLLAGDSLAQNLTVSNVAPIITAHSFSGINLLDLTGNRFQATSADPADTQVFVDGNQMDRPSGTNPSPDTQDRADLSNVTPGKHTAVLKKKWTMAATGHDFILSSNEISVDKPIGQPTNLVWREVKDTKINVTWENAPFTQVTEVEIWDVLSATRVATDTVTDKFYEFTGLNPSTSYEVRLRNRAGTVVSQPLTGTNSTKSTAAYQVQTISLVDSDNLLNQGIALDFVAAEGKFFVAHTQSTDLYITGYSADGTASQSQSVSVSTSAPFFTDVSMVYGGGLLFICYRNSTQIVEIRSFNTNLMPQNSVAMPGTSSETQMIYAGSKLFIVCSAYSNDTNSQHNLYEITAPATLSGVQSIGSINTSLSDSLGYLAMVAADESTNSLFFVSPYTYVSQNDSFLIKRYDLDNPLSTFSDLSVVPSNNVGYGVAVHQFKAGGGRIMLRCGSDQSDTWLNRLYFIDQRTGSAFLKTADGDVSPFNGRGEYVVDSKSRIWMGEINPAGRYFIQTAVDGLVSQSNKIPGAFVETYSFGNYPFPDPANYIELDPVTNSMNFLYRDSGGGLSVFQFSSDY